MTISSMFLVRSVVIFLSPSFFTEACCCPGVSVQLPPISVPSKPLWLSSSTPWERPSIVVCVFSFQEAGDRLLPQGLALLRDLACFAAMNALLLSPSLSWSHHCRRPQTILTHQFFGRQTGTISWIWWNQNEKFKHLFLYEMEWYFIFCFLSNNLLTPLSGYYCAFPPIV